MYPHKHLFSLFEELFYIALYNLTILKESINETGRIQQLTVVSSLTAYRFACGLKRLTFGRTLNTDIHFVRFVIRCPFKHQHLTILSTILRLDPLMTFLVVSLHVPLCQRVRIISNRFVIM